MAKRWTKEQAWAWYDSQPWLTGCNFIPSTAINQIEMFSAETFDPETIDRELGWAASIGFNTVRTYLHDICWREDPEGFLSRLDRYLAIASSHGIRTLITIFDDCWYEPVPGRQPAPRPGLHNSGWARSPGRNILLDRTKWGELETYVRSLGDRFGQDQRVLAWDVYNEVINLVMPSRSLSDAEQDIAVAAIEQEREIQLRAALELMTQAFGWLRSCGVSQPLTAGIYYDHPELNERLVDLSDIVSFHHYTSLASLERMVERLKDHGRPLFCTEYLDRRGECTFATHMSVFQRERIACWNWGLVDGKTQTKFAWSDPGGTPDPDVWFHDLFKADGTPFDEEEVRFIRALREQATKVREPTG